MSQLLESITVRATDSIDTVLRCQSSAVDRGLPAGIVIVSDSENQVEGVITDGDIRRALIKDISRAHKLTAADLMTQNPITFPDTFSYRQIIDALPQRLSERGRRSRKFLGKVLMVNEKNQATRVINYHELWEQRVASHRHVVVLGLGYVGLTLALELSREGFRVTGVDVSQDRIAKLKNNESYVHEIGLPELLRDQLNRNFFPTTQMPEDGDVFIVSVGTPVLQESESGIPKPQLSQITSAATMVGKSLKPGSLVILRSTVPVGCTRDIVIPILEQTSELKAGRDFHVSFAPERTVEGKALRELRTLPQVIGGINKDSVEATAALFRDLTPMLVRVDSLESAELVKLINNTFRDLVFSYANQLAQIGAHFNIDVVDVIRAANHGYPRDKVPLPSPGVGGPCLTKDPYIMHEVSKRAGIESTLFLQGRVINESMCGTVADSLLEKLKSQGYDSGNTKILACGLAFKGEPETGDLRSSTGAEIALDLKARGWNVVGHDPVASAEDIRQIGLEAAEFDDAIGEAAVLLVLNNHRFYRNLDIAKFVRQMPERPIIFDTWHIFEPDLILDSKPCTYMGLGFTRSSLDHTDP
ncbi:MAG: nucleotide sugar dehydrogenase [Myxococcota bacterium]|nr:nucleotide sugar dehydrogenase [Myxococcota bacterium]